MAEIKVTASELRNKAEELRRWNSSLREAADRLAADERALAGMWEGESKEAFRSSFGSDRRRLEEFISAIERYCRALELNAREYERAERKNLSSAGG